MKSALTPSQLFARRTEDGQCSPIEVYLGGHEDLADAQGLDLVDQLIREAPGFFRGHPSDLLYIFHLPVGTQFNLEALAFNRATQELVLAYLQRLRDRDFPVMRLLTHLECTPETIQALGLGPALIKGLKAFAAPDVELYIEQTQFYTADGPDIRVFPAWEDSVFRYRHWLAEALPDLQLRTVVDVCHVMNSQQALQALKLSQLSQGEALIRFLRQNVTWGPDHIHLSCGRGCLQGAQWHGCGFDTEEERQVLRTLLGYLLQTGYRGALVTETNEQSPEVPKRMHTLRRQIQEMCAELQAEAATPQIEEELP